MINANYIARGQIFDNYTKQLIDPSRLLEHKSAEGFVPDILQVMSETHDLEIEYVESFDGYYGTKVDGSWNGLIKMVLDETVDFVATDLAMILQRSLGT